MGLRFDAKSLQALADLAAQLQVEQIRAGLDREGNPFPPGVDLIASGRLLASIKGVVAGGVPQVVADTPYAQIVDRRYHFLGLSPRYRDELARRWQKEAARGVSLEE